MDLPRNLKIDSVSRLQPTPPRQVQPPRALAGGKPLSVTVASCMTPNPVTVHPKDAIGVAVRRMEEGGYRHLPVVDEAGRAVGVLSVKRIVHYLVEPFPATVYNLPPDPGA